MNKVSQKSNFQNKSTTSDWRYRELTKNELDMVSGGNENDGAEATDGHGYAGYGGDSSAYGDSGNTPTLGTVTVTAQKDAGAPSQSQADACAYLGAMAGASAGLITLGLGSLFSPLVGALLSAIVGPIAGTAATNQCLADISKN